MFSKVHGTHADRSAMLRIREGFLLSPDSSAEQTRPKASVQKPVPEAPALSTRAVRYSSTATVHERRRCTGPFGSPTPQSDCGPHIMRMRSITTTPTLEIKTREGSCQHNKQTYNDRGVERTIKARSRRFNALTLIEVPCCAFVKRSFSRQTLMQNQ